jgi:hypothetical protein
MPSPQCCKSSEVWCAHRCADMYRHALRYYLQQIRVSLRRELPPGGVVEETALQREDADVLVFSGVLVRPVSGAEDATPSTSQSEPSRPGSAEFAAVSKSLAIRTTMSEVRTTSLCEARHTCSSRNYRNPRRADLPLTLQDAIVLAFQPVAIGSEGPLAWWGIQMLSKHCNINGGQKESFQIKDECSFSHPFGLRLPSHFQTGSRAGRKCEKHRRVTIKPSPY